MSCPHGSDFPAICPWCEDDVEAIMARSRPTPSRRTFTPHGHITLSRESVERTIENLEEMRTLNSSAQRTDPAERQACYEKINIYIANSLVVLRRGLK